MTNNVHKKEMWRDKRHIEWLNQSMININILVIFVNTGRSTKKFPLTPGSICLQIDIERTCGIHSAKPNYCYSLTDERLSIYRSELKQNDRRSYTKYFYRENVFNTSHVLPCEWDGIVLQWTQNFISGFQPTNKHDIQWLDWLPSMVLLCEELINWSL